MHYIFIQLLPHYHVLLDAIKSTFWIAYNRVTNQFNDCHKTCRDLKIILGGGNIKVTKCMISTDMFVTFIISEGGQQDSHYIILWAAGGY